MTDFVSLDEVLGKQTKNKSKNVRSKESLVSERKNVYNKTGKKVQKFLDF